MKERDKYQLRRSIGKTEDRSKGERRVWKRKGRRGDFMRSRKGKKKETEGKAETDPPS